MFYMHVRYGSCTKQTKVGYTPGYFKLESQLLRWLYIGGDIQDLNPLITGLT